MMGKPKLLMNLEGPLKGWVSGKEYTLPHLRVNYSSYLFGMVCDKSAFLGHLIFLGAGPRQILYLRN